MSFPGNRAALVLFALLGLGIDRSTCAADSTTVAPRRIVFQDTVLVRATKLPFRLDDLTTSAMVLQASQIRLGTARSLQDALAPVPGAHILDLSGSDTQGAIESRGFASQGTSSHMLVLVDEIPLNDFETDRVDWNALGLAQVSRIEFLRGPASFLYGNASMAGVVNLVTHAAGTGGTWWAQGSGGSWDRRAGAGGGAWGNARSQAALSLAGQQLDGWRDHSALETWSGYGSLHHAFTPRWDARARVLAQREDQDVPGPLERAVFDANPRAAGTPLDYRHGRILGAAVELTGRLSPALGLTTLVARDARLVDATETIIPVGALDRLSRIGVTSGEMRLHWAPAFGWTPHVLLGADIQQGDLRSEYQPVGARNGENLLGSAHVQRMSGGVFSVLQLHPLARWTIDAGARLDWLRSRVDVQDGAGDRPHDDLEAFSPTLGTSVDLRGLGHAYASYAGSFKAPTIEQLYDVRPFEVGLPFPITISYHALQPQRGQHVEAGLRSRWGAVAASEVTVYYAQARNEIGFDLAEFHHINIGRSTHAGVEAQLSTTPEHGVSAQLSYAYTRAVFDGGDHDGRQINTVPEHQAQARVTVANGVGGTFSLEGAGVRNQWIDEDDTLPIAPYVLFGLGAAQPIGKFELFGSVRNLFDRRYATLGYVSLGPTPLYFPGAARSFELGIRLRGPAGSVAAE
jgi:iron complex outermembrane recepter protein